MLHNNMSGTNNTKKVAILTLLAITFRVLVSNSSYSGQSKPRMYGDYEAQRHWMELTINLPIGEWYQNTSNNDLLYWGLDYPPLTAYTSWVCGKVSEIIEPPAMILFTSRGYESQTHKIFMRVSVLLLDLSIYFPAVWSVLGHLYPQPSQKGKKIWAYLLALSQPALILIDHGHFQYNSVCLGLSLWAVSAILSGYDVIGSILFCLALNFKQIALYYAPAFFFLLLGNCFCKLGPGPQRNWLAGLLHLVKLGTTVIGTFGVLWLPFCLWPYPGTTCLASLGQVLHRLFPFARGIFEDKVANVWYFLSVTVRIRNYLERSALVSLSLATTLILLAPTCYVLIRKKKSARCFLLGLTWSSLAFFLTAFQVHEKSLLFVLAPLSLLSAEFPIEVAWFSLYGSFSMFPLLIKDGLRLPYFACLGNFGILLLAFLSLNQPLSSNTCQKTQLTKILFRIAIRGSLVMFLVLHVLEAFFSPPKRFPDLHASVFSLLSFVVFMSVFLVGMVCFLHSSNESAAASDSGRKIE